MSGIVAAAQSSGCCCRPAEGCLCDNPNRPGAVLDRQMTAISVDAQIDIREQLHHDSCPNFGCSCPCSSGFPADYGTPPGPMYSYKYNGAVVDPDFTEGTECESIACKRGCCGGCPTLSIGPNFGSQTLDQVSAGAQRWRTMFTDAFSHQIASWNWQPRQVGYCVDPNSGIRVRRYCIGPFGGWSAGPFPGDPRQPDLLINAPSGIVDPNGQYLTPAGAYTGANVGLCSAYAFADIEYGSIFEGQCGYLATLHIAYMFMTSLRDIVRISNNRWDPYSNHPYQRPFTLGSAYFKPCESPSDTVLGTYVKVLGDDTYIEWVDPECGRIRGFYEFDMTFPQTIEVS